MPPDTNLLDFGSGGDGVKQHQTYGNGGPRNETKTFHRWLGCVLCLYILLDSFGSDNMTDGANPCPVCKGVFWAEASNERIRCRRCGFHSASTTPPAPEDRIKKIIKVLDGDGPEYHQEGMGCGLEDRNITDRYEAMEYGWEAAMERVYSEVINYAKDELSALSTKSVADPTPAPQAPETRTADEILRDPKTYELVEALLYLAEDGHLTETPTKTVAGVYTLKATSDARIDELNAELSTARNEAFTKAAKIAYMVCANTRHVTLGETAVKAIHALKTPITATTMKRREL